MTDNHKDRQQQPDSDWLIRHARPEDGIGIMKIKNHAILHTTTVYDLEQKDLAFYQNWLEHKNEVKLPVFVICPADNPDCVAGYATYGSFRPHPAYHLTVENSIYVSPDQQHQGLGTLLLHKLVASAREEGYHLMVAAIDSRNQASCHMHEKMGFSKAGTIHEAGRKFDHWLDVVFYELILNGRD